MSKPAAKRRTSAFPKEKKKAHRKGADQAPATKPIKHKRETGAPLHQARASAQRPGHTESKQARAIAMLRAPSGATIEALMRATGDGSRIPSAGSSPAWSAKSLASILCQRQPTVDGSIGLRTGRLPAPSRRRDPMKRSRPVARKIAKPTLEGEIAQLRDLDLKGLRLRWQSMFRRQAPSHLPRHLLLALMAYRLQADQLGDLATDTVRLLKQIASKGTTEAAVRLTSEFDRRRADLKPGTILMRAWKGCSHRVTVVDEGFAWNGKTYDSLSKIACAITGTKWNGPRFFGLRDKVTAEVET